MIKKLIWLLSCVLLIAGCSTKEESVSVVEEIEEKTEEISEETVDVQEETSSEKILVVYFSRAGENWEVGNVKKGSTRIVAEYIAETIGADLFEIEPVEPYPESYDEMLEIASAEQKENVRPEIKNEPENWDQYDTIVLGYPIWYADMPMIVYNFLETYDFNGKVIYPFDTHGGSGLAGTVNSIKETVPGIEVKEGLPIVGKAVQNQFEDTKSIIDQWLKDNQLKKEETAGFNFDNRTVTLNNGLEMPVIGIGTFHLSSEEAENSVYWALRDGYRLIDTAKIYGNEDGVGRGIQRAIDEGIATREEIFVTTKMWTSDYSHGKEAIDESLQKLGLDYIDLMILHHSQPSNDIDAYKAMEQAVAEGKLKSIGLSNYYEPDDFDRVVQATDILPAVLQNETHPYFQNMEMKNHIAQYGTIPESWFPLGGRGHTQTLFTDETIASIAKAHGKTSAQILLRWHLQAGNIAIPGSSNEDHIQENIEIFDFTLTEEEMQKITDLDKNERFATY